FPVPAHTMEMPRSRKGIIGCRVPSVRQPDALPGGVGKSHLFRADEFRLRPTPRRCLTPELPCFIPIGTNAKLGLRVCLSGRGSAFAGNTQSSCAHGCGSCY